MAPQPYYVGIDLGTTFSASAVCRAGEPRPEAVPLGTVTAAVASMVFLAPDGSMVCGEAAHRRAVTDPRRVVREFKRRIGDGTPLVVGGRLVAAETVAARFVAWILERVAEREGGPADRVALTHPADWGTHKRKSVASALAAHGVADVLFLSEPEAAAIGYASTERVDVGATVAVYDLGGGTFDAAVVRKLADGGFEVLGKPVGIPHLGGVDFDEAVFDHVRQAVGDAWHQLDPADPAVQTAVAGLRRECTAAKEALSADTEVMIPVMLPGQHSQVRLGRAELEEQIRPAVVETVEALLRAVDSAGTPADVDAVLMVGGSSRIPLVTQLVSAELGRPIAVDVDPKSVIAAGAAVFARGPLAVAAQIPSDDGPAVAALLVAGGGPGHPADAQPPCPPRDLDPVLGDHEPANTRPRRLRMVTLAAALSVAATLGIGAATLASGAGPADSASGSAFAVGGGSGFAAAAEAAEPSHPGTGVQIDPWTGARPTDTTVPGPQRPAVVPAAAPPAARLTSTGATGASPADGPAAATVPPGDVVAPGGATGTTGPGRPGQGTDNGTVPPQSTPAGPVGQPSDGQPPGPGGDGPPSTTPPPSTDPSPSPPPTAQPSPAPSPTEQPAADPSPPPPTEQPPPDPTPVEPPVVEQAPSDPSPAAQPATDQPPPDTTPEAPAAT